MDARLFRRVMGQFASGVTVVTTGEGDETRGMTANAFMSGSLEPPLCVVSIAKRAHLHEYLLRAESFGVSILREDQEQYSRHFAGRPTPGFSVAFRFFGRIPLLAEACARIATEIVDRHDCGDHTLFIGHIVYLDYEEAPPLVYHASHYARLVELRGDHDVPVPEFW